MKPRALFVLAVVLAVLAAYSVARMPARQVATPRLDSARPAAQDTATPAVIYWGDPIFTAADAIALTLERFPQGFNPHGPVARLISVDTLWQVWYQGTAGGDFEYGATTPVWIVGILGDGMTQSDAVDLPGIGTGVISDTTPVHGMWYAWYANDGLPAGSGGLLEDPGRSYADLAALPTEDLPISQPTLVLP
jgi:hypothetical protein